MYPVHRQYSLPLPWQLPELFCFLVELRYLQRQFYLPVLPGRLQLPGSGRQVPPLFRPHGLLLDLPGRAFSGELQLQRVHFRCLLLERLGSVRGLF